MASVIQIANRALTKLGAARIISLGDDNKQSRAVLSCFDDLRDDELRSHRWSFAMRRTSLAADSEAPDFGFTYAYTLPADFLRLDMVNDEFPAVVMDNYIGVETNDYTIEGNKILANMAAPLKLRYIARIEDPNQMDVNFREALSCRIAAELAEDLTQSNQKRELAWNEYKQAVSRAVRTNAIEKPPMMQGDNQWIMSRL